MDAEERKILMEIHSTCGILEERTAGLPKLKERVTTVEADINWLKRIVWALVPAGASAAGLITAAFKWL